MTQKQPNAYAPGVIVDLKNELSTHSVTRRTLFSRMSFAVLSVMMPNVARAKASVRSWGAEKKRIVVIGSGIGGLAAAALFAKEGHQVTVLEMNGIIGGHGRHLERQGLKFSMGPQYVWHFTKAAVGDRFLKFLGLAAKAPFDPMDANGFETIWIKQDEGQQPKHFAVPVGLDKFRDKLLVSYPAEAEGITRYFDDMIAITKGFQAFTDQYGLKGFWKTYINLIFKMNLPLALKIKIIKAASMALKDWFDIYGLSEEVRSIVYGHSGIYAENEKEVSTLIYMIGTGYYHDGSHYPRYGFDAFFESLRDVVNQRGGVVLTSKKVVRLESAGKEVKAVICSDGSIYPCDAVFSNISPRLTAKLLAPELAQVYTYEPSHGIIVCMIGIRGKYPGLEAIRGKNYWWLDGKGPIEYTEVAIDQSPRMLYVTSHTENGFGKVDNADENSSLTVFVPTHFYKESSLMQDSPEAFAAYRERVVSDVIRILDTQIFPGIADQILFGEAVTSLDLLRDTDSERGNVYGKRLSVSEYKRGRIADLDVTNLYPISATSGGPGVARGILNAVTLLKDLTGRIV